MARYSGVTAKVEGRVIHVGFELDSPAVVGWQIYDPDTSAFLFEGEWRDLGARASLDVELPEEDGPYRVQIAPVEQRDRFVVVDARVHNGVAEISPPRIGTAAGLAISRALRAIPKAFAYPPRALWRNRKLIASMVRRDILSRYKGSFGG